jgi:hypothetical protein
MNDSALLPMLRERLPRGAKASNADVVDRYFSVILGRKAEGSRTPRYYNLLYGNHSLLARSFKLGEVLEAFDSWVRFSVAELTDRRVFVHAGVVGWKNRAILIPGKSFAGKQASSPNSASGCYLLLDGLPCLILGAWFIYQAAFIVTRRLRTNQRSSRNWRARGIKPMPWACTQRRYKPRPLEATATISGHGALLLRRNRPSPPVTSGARYARTVVAVAPILKQAR